MCEAKNMGMGVEKCDVKNCSGDFCPKLNINLSEVKAANRQRHAFERKQPGGSIVDKFYNRVEETVAMRESGV